MELLNKLIWIIDILWYSSRFNILIFLASQPKYSSLCEVCRALLPVVVLLFTKAKTRLTDFFRNNPHLKK